MQINRLDNLLKMLESQPNDAFLTYAVGLEYMNSENLPKAWEYFEQLLRSNPDYLPVYYQGALLLIQMQQIEEAKALLFKGVDLAQQLGERKTLNELNDLLEQMED
jgi:tetratricopeptide (TPR) repeat protein